MHTCSLCFYPSRHHHHVFPDFTDNNKVMVQIWGPFCTQLRHFYTPYMRGTINVS